MSISRKYVIGLLLPRSLELAREIIDGISQVSHQDSRIQLHLLSDNAHSPSQNEFPVKLDGIIAFRSGKELKKIRALAPYVVGTSTKNAPVDGDYVVNDDVMIGRMGAEYFIRRGLKNLVFAGWHGLYHSDQRFLGFQEVATKSGLEVTRVEFFNQKDVQSLPEKLAKMPSRCGVLAANDELGQALIKFTDQAVSRIPLHYAILGVDNDPLQSLLSSVPLSSIQLDGKGIGVLALNRIIARIDDPTLKDEVKLVPPLRVQTRQSTDLFSYNDELVAQLLKLIDEELHNIHDVADLVSRMDTPRRTLELRFRKATGRTLAKEMSILRVERARELLRTSNKDTETIAQEVGLPDARMLWLLFKRLTDETPSAYRKRMPMLLG